MHCMYLDYMSASCSNNPTQYRISPPQTAIKVDATSSVQTQQLQLLHLFAPTASMTPHIATLDEFQYTIKWNALTEENKAS